MVLAKVLDIPNSGSNASTPNINILVLLVSWREDNKQPLIEGKRPSKCTS